MTEREERQQHVTQPTVKLSPFWPQAPALWFKQAECSFTIKKIEAQFDRYCHVVAALPHESLRLVADPLRRHQNADRGFSSALRFPEG